MSFKSDTAQAPFLKVVYECSDGEINEIITQRSFTFFSPTNGDSSKIQFPIAKKFKSNIMYNNRKVSINNSLVINRDKLYSDSKISENNLVLPQNIYHSHIKIYDIQDKTWKIIIVDRINYIAIKGTFDMPGLVNIISIGWHTDNPSLLMNINLFFEKNEAIKNYILEKERKFRSKYEKKIKELEVTY